MNEYRLKLHKTYYNKGFFNVPVGFDRFVRHDEGKIQISLSGNSTIEGRVDRNSNLNGTARIMGGVLLRDWFQNNFRELDELLVEFILPDKIKIKR